MSRSIEVCFSPALYHLYHKPDAVVMVTDILRATSAICTAFNNGVRELIPVESTDEARSYKEKGYIVAAERDGIKLEFADFGNSPFNFTPEAVKGKTIVYSTTNGTEAIHLASSSYRVIIGSFLNLTASCRYLSEMDRDVLVLCAGWKDKFNLEDSVHAGAVVECLTEQYGFQSTCDSALASMDLWKTAKGNLVEYMNKAAQRSRLRKNLLDDVIPYCLTLDAAPVIPVFSEGKLSPHHT
ncbi:MAG: 2-phosphosulfolactate phosphatase [Bacteroidales bacterium]